MLSLLAPCDDLVLAQLLEQPAASSSLEGRAQPPVDYMLAQLLEQPAPSALVEGRAQAPVEIKLSPPLASSSLAPDLEPL